MFLRSLFTIVLFAHAAVAFGQSPIESYLPTRLPADSAAEPATTATANCPSVECPGPCGPPGHAWVNFEWLYWAASGQSLPPLATTAPSGTSRNFAGTLGPPTTHVLFGGSRANDDFRNGFRFSGGMWLNCDQTCGIDGEFFFLGQSKNNFAAASDGSQIISRPFFNVITGQPDVELVSFPGTIAGSLSIGSTTNAIGGGLNGIKNLCCSPCGRLDLLVGYRYFNLTDEVTIAEDLTSLGGASPVPSGVRFQVTDQFRTENNFHGGVIGLAAERRFSNWFFGLRASVALGANQQIAEIAGSTVITPPGGVPQKLNGGLLALPTNIGHYEQTVFAVMPQIGLKAGVQVTKCIRAFAGYDFLYLSNVLRAGDQIDLAVNPNYLPGSPNFGVGPPRPAFPGHQTDVWLQGVSLGVSVMW